MRRRGVRPRKNFGGRHCKLVGRGERKRTSVKLKPTKTPRLRLHLCTASDKVERKEKNTGYFPANDGVKPAAHTTRQDENADDDSTAATGNGTQGSHTPYKSELGWCSKTSHSYDGEKGNVDKKVGPPVVGSMMTCASGLPLVQANYSAYHDTICDMLYDRASCDARVTRQHDGKESGRRTPIPH